jgi:ferric-dicitrate binding protein FerR (iron transport regulator)
MTTPRYERLLARLLAQSNSVERTPTPEQSARAVVEIERALVAKQQRRIRNRRLAFLASAGAVVAVALWGVFRETGRIATGESEERLNTASDLVVITGYPSGSGSEWQQNGQTHALTGPLQIREGSRVQASDVGSVVFKLSTGTELQLEKNGILQISERSKVQRFGLDLGSLAAHVAKLEPAQRFIVATPDTEIEVRGTRFILNVMKSPSQGCTPESRTQLDVQEGLVEVRSARSSVMVHAGEHWPNCVAQRRQEPVVPPSVAGTSGELVSSKVVSVPGVASRATPEPGVQKSKAPHAIASTSDLAAQNDLFAEAVAARKRGDNDAALAAYTRLLAQYPGSVLVENAMVERLRLLAALQRPEAASEAQRYLRRFPTGFARAEAQGVAAGR